MAGEISINGKATGVPSATQELLDLEAENEKERRARIGAVTLEIEAILLREDMTVGDLLEIFGLFTGRANSLFEKTKIKDIKQNYERTI